MNQPFFPLDEMEPHMESFYQVSLKLSFKEHVYWLCQGGMYCVMRGQKALRWKDKNGKEDAWFFLEPGTVEGWREKIFNLSDSDIRKI